MGKPDIEALDISKRLVNVNDIFDVTTKPLIMDVDTGGMLEHFEINVKTIERVGVSAIIVEDKIGLKRNSLFGTEADQQQDEIENFCKKMSAGRNAKQSDDFLIIARIESLILERGMKDALTRADAYIASGADGIMIHSRRESPNEILEFAKLFRDKHKWIPLVCVPTAYNSIYESELAKAGFNMVIYANQLMRASYPAMQNIAHEILRYGRAHEIESSILSISDVLKVIPRN
jgi:phosphoenolpyruvate phosphomutase